MKLIRACFLFDSISSFSSLGTQNYEPEASQTPWKRMSLVSEEVVAQRITKI